ncbi:MAG: radical SAM protein [Chloroflexota bacterium]
MNAPTGGHAPQPEYVQIEPVGQCNLSCQMCAIQYRTDGTPGGGPPAFMRFDHYTRLVDGFPRLKHLHLQGLGEPMMHPRFFDMVSYAVGRGVRVTTNSNLTLLNPGRAERCVTSGLDELHVSIDGARPETYERIRSGARHARVLHNLELLLEARARLLSQTPHLKLVMVIMRQNLDELPELVRLAPRWAMEEIFVQHLSHDFSEAGLPEQYRPMRAFVEQQTLLNEDLERVERRFEEARQAAAELGIRLRLPRPRPRLHPPGTPGSQRCSWPWSGAYISYDGQAMPCCMVSTPDRANLGSLLDAPVEQVWNGERYTRFREQLASDTPPAICQACSIYHGTF